MKTRLTVIPFLKNHGVIAVLLIAWTFLHISFLPGKHPWNDEFFSILAATGRIGQVMELLDSSSLVQTTAGGLLGLIEPDPEISTASFFWILAENDIHPPAFFLLLRLWMLAGARSITAISLLPLFISGLGIIVFYLLAKDVVGAPYHHLPVVLWMISIQGWSAAAEIRHYSLLFLFSVALLRMVVAIYRDPDLLSRRHYPWLVGLIMALGLLTHYMFVWLVGGLNLWVFTNKKIWQNRRVFRWLRADVIGFLILLPWLPMVFLQFRLQTEMAAYKTGLFEAGYKLIETMVRFVIWPTSLLTIPVILLALLFIFGLLRPAFPGFRFLIMAVILVCMVMPTLLKVTGGMQIYLFKVRYLLPALPVVLLVIGQGTAALPGRMLRGLAAVLIVFSVGANLIHFMKYEKMKNDSQRLSPASSFAAAAGSFEQKAPRNVTFVFDCRRPGPVMYLASNINIGRTVLIGDYMTLTDTLPEWTKNNRPAGIFFVHKTLSIWDRDAIDTTDEIIRALESEYQVQAGPLEIDAWRCTYLLRNDRY